MLRLLLLFFSVVFVACSQQRDEIKVMLDDTYSITIPSYLKQTTDLQPQLAVQLQNEDKEIYLIVITENKTQLKQLNLPDTLSGYYTSIMAQPFLSQLNQVESDTASLITQNGYNAFIANISGSAGEKTIYYKIGFVNTAESICQIIMWTHLNKKELFNTDMQKIIESFKEEKNT
jgi:hypothetical protein